MTKKGKMTNGPKRPKMPGKKQLAKMTKKAQNDHKFLPPNLSMHHQLFWDTLCNRYLKVSCGHLRLLIQAEPNLQREDFQEKCRWLRSAEKCSNMEHFQVVERGARPLEEKLEGVGQEESAAPLPPTSKKVSQYWLHLRGIPLFSVHMALPFNLPLWGTKSSTV